MLIKVKPTSPGRRGLVKVVTPGLHKGKPVAGLVERQSKKSGRNAYGRITMRHQGGGHKQHYRIVDFKRDKDAIPAKVERIEYDPNRSAHLALLCFADGERRYIIADRGVSVGMQLISGAEAPIKSGNALPLRNIPVGTTICCVEMLPGKGAQLARAAGTSAQLLAREGEYAQLRLRSFVSPFAERDSADLPDMARFDSYTSSTRLTGARLTASPMTLSGMSSTFLKRTQPLPMSRRFALPLMTSTAHACWNQIAVAGSMYIVHI